MSRPRLITTIGVVSLFFALSPARADKDFRTSSDADDVITVVATDNDQDSSAVNIGSLGDILTRAELDSFLNTGSGLDSMADAVDLDITDPGSQAERGKVKSVGIRDLLVPLCIFLLGTGLTSFALFTRPARRHSRRPYFSRHPIVTLPPSRIASPRTSPSAGSSEPNLHENSARSSPRKRLA